MVDVVTDKDGVDVVIDNITKVFNLYSSLTSVSVIEYSSTCKTHEETRSEYRILAVNGNGSRSLGNSQS